MSYPQAKQFIQMGIDSQSQDSQVLSYVARTCINNYSILAVVIDNKYTDSDTLDFIVNSICNTYKVEDFSKRCHTQYECERFREWMCLMENIAKRANLSFRSSLKLISLNRYAINRELSLHTVWEPIRKTLLIKHTRDKTIVGNVLSKTTTCSIIDRYIKKMVDEKEEMGYPLINYLARRIIENPILQDTQMIQLIKSGNSIPEMILAHPNLSEEVFETLLSNIKFIDVTTKIALAIISVPFVSYYESVVKLLVLNRNICMEKVIMAILRNRSISNRVVEYVIYNHMSLITGNSKLFREAIIRLQNEDEQLIEKIICNANDGSLDAGDITCIFQALPITKLSKLYSVICQKTRARNSVAVRTFIKYVPVQYWELLFNRSNVKAAVDMIRDERCPKEILTKVVLGKNYDYFIMVANNPNCDVEIASYMYHSIKLAFKVRFQKREAIFKSIYNRFGEDLLIKVWNRNTSDLELYSIFELAPSEVKVIIAETIAGNYFKLVEEYAIALQDKEIYLALSRNLRNKRKFN